jgi:hypothetical protein
MYKHQKYKSKYHSLMGPEDPVFTPPPPPPGFKRQDPKPIGNGRSSPSLYGPYDVSKLPPVPIFLQSLNPIYGLDGTETLDEFLEKAHFILLHYSTHAKIELLKDLKIDQEDALATFQKRHMDTQKEIQEKLNDIWNYIKALYHFSWVTIPYEDTNAKKDKLKDSYCKSKTEFITQAQGYDVELGEEPGFAKDGCTESHPSS